MKSSNKQLAGDLNHADLKLVRPKRHENVNFPEKIKIPIIQQQKDTFPNTGRSILQTAVYYFFQNQMHTRPRFVGQEKVETLLLLSTEVSKSTEMKSSLYGLKPNSSKFMFLSTDGPDPAAFINVYQNVFKLVNLKNTDISFQLSPSSVRTKRFPGR